MTAFRLTPKQEKFCAVYLETGNASEAYRTAGYKVDTMSDVSIRAEASKLLKHPNISLRLNAARTQIQQRTEYNLAVAMQEAWEDRVKAHELGQIGAANSATRLRAQLMGLLIEKQETTHKGDISSLLGMVDGKSRTLPNDDGDTPTTH